MHVGVVICEHFRITRSNFFDCCFIIILCHLHVVKQLVPKYVEERNTLSEVN